jgi:hypothetical protein
VVANKEADFDECLSSQEEKETIKTIAERSADTSTCDIVDLSHKEKSWKELDANHASIRYQPYAFELKAL